MLNLDNLKKLAKQLVRWHRERYFPVAQRIRAVLPDYRGLDDDAILSRPFSLADAQELIARELGFETGRPSESKTPSYQESKNSERVDEREPQGRREVVR